VLCALTVPSSFDFTSLTCGSGDLGTITGYVAQYANNGAQAKYNGNVLVSTFSGDSCSWNANGDVYTGWTNFRNTLKGQSINIYLVPAIFSATSTFGGVNSWMDAEFNWNSGWPVNTGSNLDFSGDTTYLNALNAAGKGYMAALSPAFFTYYGPSSYNKDWIYRSDNWLLATRFEMLIANRNKFDMVEIISWNGASTGVDDGGTTDQARLRRVPLRRADWRRPAQLAGLDQRHAS
jgi:glucan endo-1,3-alpha-glucosidase